MFSDIEWTTIIIEHSTGIQISNNVLENNNVGIGTHDMHNNIIKQNEIKNTLQSAIMLCGHSSSNSVFENVINDANLALNLCSNAANNEFFQNTISNIERSIVHGDGTFQTHLPSNENKIYNNNLHGTLIIESIPKEHSSLPLPIGGNYWSDYDSDAEGCTDSNYDNICDSPLGDSYNGLDTLPWNIPDGWKTTISSDGDITAEATSLDGIPISFPVSASKNGQSVTVTCDHTSGSTFPLGTTQIICSTAEGRTISFMVNVEDSTPPTINAPADFEVNTDYAEGISVEFDVTATDLIGLSSPASCNMESGSMFPLGESVITCTATDTSGNTGIASFKIKVVTDIEPPVINVPSDITVDATSQSGASVEYPTVTATDPFGIMEGPTCDRPSNAFFQVGTTIVKCTAKNNNGFVSETTFSVKVTPFIPPIPEPIPEPEQPDVIEPEIPQFTPQTLTFYVEPLPNWAYYANDVVDIATHTWKESNINLEFFETSSPSQADFRVQWVKEFGVEHVGYALGSQFIEVGLGDSNCGGNWQPYSETYVANIMIHEVGHILGVEHNNDPSNIMHPIIPYYEYGLIEQNSILAENYAQFIPLCTNRDVTNFDYYVETDDPSYGFSVYFVPSANEFDSLQSTGSFDYFSGNGCHVENMLSVGGSCNNVSSGSGILIVMGDTTTKPLANITIKIEEDIRNKKSWTDIADQSNTQATLGSSLEIPDVLQYGSKPILDFVDQSKDTSHYVKSYLTELQFRHWFDTNFPDYTIYEGIGISKQEYQMTINDLCSTTSYAACKHLATPTSVLTESEPTPTSVLTESEPTPTSVLTESEPTPTSCGEGTVLKDNECVIEEEKGGGCLIATAAFGSEMAPQVQFLRELRDNTVLQTQSGTSFMTGFNQFYYSFSPAVADYERGNPVFKEAVKLTLTPLLTSLAILNYVDIDTEQEMLGYGIGVILLNIGMYFVAPAVVIISLKKRFKF
jgi:hypothetical protein